jgi:pimeloyl-ACP methyl ester carboxylesterase
MAASRQQASRGRSLGRIARIVLAVAAGLAIAVGVDMARLGGPRLWLVRHGLPAIYLGGGRLVDVDGRSLYLDCRGTGSPTVVLEAGMGGGAASWSAVLDEVAATTRVCAYDRAGMGSSSPRGRHTLADAAADLRAALAAANEQPPYLLVGHSLGGAYARVFAARHPAETAGLIMLDTFDPDLQSAWIHPLLAELRPEYDAELQGLRDLVAGYDNLDWPASEEQLRTADLGEIPIEVLVAARYEPRLDAATNARIADAWIRAYRTLTDAPIRYEIAQGSGHVIPADRPDLVVAAIRRQVEEARARAREAG